MARLTTYQLVGMKLVMTATPDLGDSRTPRGHARDKLIAAAHQEVRRQGYSATTVDQICAAAGVTKGAFFHHFESKEALAESPLGIPFAIVRGRLGGSAMTAACLNALARAGI